MEQNTSRQFVRSYLPWILAAVMLGLYLVTLNKHVTLSSVLPVARWSGLDWRPVFTAPVTWLVTLPVRWLPAGLHLVSLNLIAAACAALTLALLARSVALLPQDRTHEQRLRESSDNGLLSIPLAWVPPVFAVLLLGLQRSFWENAIVNTGEMIDLLLVAYIVRCLLEFRLSQRDSWLYKLSFVYGLGVTNNFAFIPYAPVIVVAVVWVKALRFFQFSFLIRMTAFGLLGLLFYFLLPIVQTLNDTVNTSFIEALRVNLGYQKQFVTGVHRLFALWLGGFPLALLLIAAIRWSSGFGDNSRIGSFVGTAMAHLLHLGLLVFAVWIMLDMAMSPRFISQKEPRVFGLAFLGSYYLTALAAGYFTGYLLLIFSDYVPRNRRSAPSIAVPLSYLVTVVVCAVAVAAPVRLAMVNIPRVRAINATEFRDYAKHQFESLPQQPTAVLSDDPSRLYAVALSGGLKAGHMLIEGNSLNEPVYLRTLLKRYPGALPDGLRSQTNGLSGDAMISLLGSLKEKRDLFYLHPSFGFYFETFYLEPYELVYRLDRYPTNAVERPLPTAAALTRQGEFWNRIAPTTLRPLAAARRTKVSGPSAIDYDIFAATRYYSQALNFWGVELQRSGRFDDAFKYFDQAVAVNPDNTAAFINREANIQWRKDHKRLERISDEAMAKLKRENGFESVMNNGGPIDEPAFAFELAQFFANARLWRQSAQLILRSLSYSPDDVTYQHALAAVYLNSGQPDKTLNVIKTLRSGRTAALPPEAVVEIIRTEAAAYFAKGDFATAERLLKDAVTRYPEQNGSFDGLASYYTSRAELFRQAGKQSEADAALTNALRITEQQVQQQPNNPAAHFNLGNRALGFKDFDRAIAEFTRVVEADPKNLAALLNRAIANLQAGRLDAAQRDYQRLLEFTRTSFRVYFGLAEIAYQKKNWSAARDYYEKYLKYAPQDSAETQFVRNRLAEVKKKS